MMRETANVFLLLNMHLVGQFRPIHQSREALSKGPCIYLRVCDALETQLELFIRQYLPMLKIRPIEKIL
jgi:hypothetical protein